MTTRRLKYGHLCNFYVQFLGCKVCTADSPLQIFEYCGSCHFFMQNSMGLPRRHLHQLSCPHYRCPDNLSDNKMCKKKKRSLVGRYGNIYIYIYYIYIPDALNLWNIYLHEYHGHLSHSRWVNIPYMVDLSPHLGSVGDVTPIHPPCISRL